MYRFSTLSTVFCLLAIASVCRAVTIDADTVIGPGSPFNGELIIVEDGSDGPTTVRIVEGGSVEGFSVLGSSQVILDGGESTSAIGLGDDAKLTVLDGSINCSSTECRSLDLGGLIQAQDNASLTFLGGYFEPNFIRLNDLSTLTVAGENLLLTPFSGSYFISGQYFDGTLVNLAVNSNSDATSRIFLIPEPGTVLIALIAAVCVCADRSTLLVANRPLNTLRSRK